MSSKIVVGIDGDGSGERAVAYATKLAKLIGSCEVILVYVIEWSPYKFQTAEENALRHKRREEEIELATTRVVAPAVKSVEAEGLTVRGIVRHGDVASLIDKVAQDERADQIVVGRSSEGGFAQRLFGTATASLVMHASVPVTVVG
ncbi:universal stress protein [Algicella marina]|uniref:Universal stress protein n=1 Tax=Algicella marina TaxID=2683284 RepID=A0A6P1T089_9RHOB|nr:universal stress protein [Algicella marina]QHQ36334.1 universal stress protein [Algicella marina]